MMKVIQLSRDEYVVAVLNDLDPGAVL